MLICDQAIREQGTGKVSLIGIFEKINTAKTPAVHFSLSVYVRVTDAQGEYDLALELVRLEDMMTVGRGQGHASISDRLEPSEFVFRLMMLQFERAGAYEFRLFANNRYLASKSFHVVKLDEFAAEQEGKPDE